MRQFFKRLCPVRSYPEQYPRLLTGMIRSLIAVFFAGALQHFRNARTGVVALEGNALFKRHKPITAEVQCGNVDL